MPSRPETAQTLLDFGLPLTVSPAAEVALLKLPRKSLKHLTGELQGWASKAPVSEAKALYYIDSEDPDLRYVLLQFLLAPPMAFDIDDQLEYEELISEELARVYAEATESMPERDKRRLTGGLTVAVTWPDDWDYSWGDSTLSGD